MNILVTGASGFIGSNFIKYTNHCIKRVVRNKSLHNHFEDCYYINDFSSNTDWDKAFRDVEVVLHLGALVHRKPKIFSQSYLNNILEANCCYFSFCAWASRCSSLHISQLLGHTDSSVISHLQS